MNLRVMVGHFVEICKWRGLKVNEDKSKAMMLEGEEGSSCEVSINGVDTMEKCFGS